MSNTKLLSEILAMSKQQRYLFSRKRQATIKIPCNYDNRLIKISYEDKSYLTENLLINAVICPRLTYSSFDPIIKLGSCSQEYFYLSGLSMDMDLIKYSYISPQDNNLSKLGRLLIRCNEIIHIMGSLHTPVYFQYDDHGKYSKRQEYIYRYFFGIFMLMYLYLILMLIFASIIAVS